MKNTYLVILLSLISFQAFGQASSAEAFKEDDLNVGGDIFQDFNEDVDANQVMEDERFYKYARFYSINLGGGFTTFTGNRGVAYTDNHPTFNFSITYFIDFQNAFVLGIALSQHTALIDTGVNVSPEKPIGRIETTMLRPYFGFRYYIDTKDLGTAITYSNPYFIGRAEYWYHTNRFPETSEFSTENEGAIGFGAGFGLEFPIEIKKTYFNFEFLYHRVAFFDKATTDYKQVPPADCTGTCKSEYGFDNLDGDVITFMFNYVISY